MFLFIKAQPTPAQAEAGNYQKQHRPWRGLDITIENPAGSIRRGVDRGGHAWATKMSHSYGYIKGTLGVDGDHFDCLLGTDEGADTVFLITTKAPPEFTKDDEQKALIGFPDEAAARAAFAKMYDNPKFFGRILALPFDEFKSRVMTTREKPQMIKGLILLFPAPGAPVG